jgi:predicted phosphohydrolase
MMTIFGISDLHLSLASNKPMDIFGEAWRDHTRRMAEAWDDLVKDEDVVLCPGDLSWAMRLTEADADLQWLGQRPGRKILTRGNHDYWWSSVSKVRATLPESCLALQNDAVSLDSVVYTGSRLWALPGSPEFGPDDEKVFKREVGRLEMGLKAAAKAAAGELPIVAAVHYPPLTEGGAATPFTDLLEAYQVRLCVYGHLHGGAAHGTAVDGEVRGVQYAFISSDFLGFSPRDLSRFI